MTSILTDTQTRTGVAAPLGKDASAWREVRVDRVERTADTVVSLRLVPVAGALPPWEPGAHVDLRLPSGLVRPYSLCGSLLDRAGYTISVLRDDAGRGGSREIHEAVSAGMCLAVRGPRNTFPLAPAPRHLFVAGGIGITPFLPMVEELDRRGASWQMVYGGRSRSSMAFLDRFESDDRVEVRPQVDYGLLDIAGILDRAGDQTAIYACGPQGLLDAIEGQCLTRGLEDRLHLERFTAAPAADPAGQLAEDSSFQVTLARTGLTVTVPPDRTLLAVIQDVVPDVACDCEDGYCGACETRVLSGVPDHRDTWLSKADQASGDYMMICVSRSRSEHLELDI